MSKQVEIAEQIARDTSCAQGEFNHRVLSIIPYLTDICDENKMMRAALQRIAAENTNPNGGMAKRCIATARDALNIHKQGGD
jgi:hypothetical protein